MEDSPAGEQHVRWAPIDLAVFILFFLAAVVLLPPAVFLILHFFDPQLKVGTLSVAQEIMIQGLMDLVIVGFILLLIKFRDGSIKTTLRVPYTQKLPLARLIAGGVFLAITVVIFSQLFPGPESALEKRLTTASAIVAFVVFGVLFAPLLEEIIFRGFVFTALADIEGTGMAIPLTALLFAIPHAYQLWGNWPALLVIFAVGYVLTIVRNRFGSIVHPIIVHTSYNAMIFGLSALGWILGRGGTR